MCDSKRSQSRILAASQPINNSYRNTEKNRQSMGLGYGRLDPWRNMMTNGPKTPKMQRLEDCREGTMKIRRNAGKIVGLVVAAGVTAAVYWGLTQKPAAPSIDSVDV